MRNEGVRNNAKETGVDTPTVALLDRMFKSRASEGNVCKKKKGAVDLTLCFETQILNRDKRRNKRKGLWSSHKMRIIISKET